MQGITVADTPKSVVIVLDKDLYSKERIAEAIRVLARSQNVDDSHIPEASDKEQKELEELLTSMSSEDREIASIHYVKAQ